MTKGHDVSLDDLQLLAKISEMSLEQKERAVEIAFRRMLEYVKTPGVSQEEDSKGLVNIDWKTQLSIAVDEVKRQDTHSVIEPTEKDTVRSDSRTAEP